MKGEVVIKPAAKSGNGAVVYVPRRWIGYIVRCECKGKPKPKEEKKK